MPIFGGTLALLIPVLGPNPLARELGIEGAMEVTPMDGVVPGKEEKDICLLTHGLPEAHKKSV